MFTRKDEQRQLAANTGGALPALPPDANATPLQFLAYALPRTTQDARSYKHSVEGFRIHDEPLGANVSFLDYDGVAMFAGAFERMDPSPAGGYVRCLSDADLDRREREFSTAFDKGIPIIFLLPALNRLPHYQTPPLPDLLRRIAQTFGIGHSPLREPHPGLESSVPEFNEYIQRHGTGYAVLSVPKTTPYKLTPICKQAGYLLGLALADKLFILPCTQPANELQVREMVCKAVAAVIAYRSRVSRELPAWVGEFSFSQEAKLISDAKNLRGQLESLETKIAPYKNFKAVLCLQSDPLVEAVVEIFDKIFGISLVGDDEKIEDKRLLDAEDKWIAIFEIKGIKGNFDRPLVNQIDDHRVRRELPRTFPGIAIVNTFRSAGALGEKDRPPNSEIIVKAVQDNVLLIRTLDLLRLADLKERGIKTGEDFKDILLHETGWMKVEGDDVMVVQE